MKIRSFSCIFPPNSLLIGTERSLIDWAVSNYLLEQIGMKVFFVHFLKKENSLPKKYFLVKIHDLKFCANSSSQFVPLANRQIKVGPCHFEVLHSGSLPLCKNDAKGQVCNAWQWQVAAVSTAINSFGFIAIFLWNDFWCNVAVRGMLKKVPFLQFLGVLLCYKIFHFKVEDRNSKLFFTKIANTVMLFSSH